MYKLKLVCTMICIKIAMYVKYQAAHQNFTSVIYLSLLRYTLKIYLVPINFINALADIFVGISKPFFYVFWLTRTGN